MAKKVKSIVKMQIPAGKASPRLLSDRLGQHGVNIMGFCKEFNERTAHQAGMVIPVVITIMEDRPLPSLRKHRLPRFC